jgi:hypothetical protein
MFQIFSNPSPSAWHADPLSHPQLAAMDERELADLPLARAMREMPRASDQGHFTSGGMLDRIEFTFPPVLSPKMVPRS